MGFCGHRGSQEIPGSHGKSSEVMGSHGEVLGAVLGFHRISIFFFISTKLFTLILQGNLGPRMSWEVLGGPRRS